MKSVSNDLKERLVDNKEAVSSNTGSKKESAPSVTSTNPIINDTKISTGNSFNVESSAQLPSENPQPSKAELQRNEPFIFTFQDFYERNFYISEPWNLNCYLSVRGCERFHIYLWIAKDMAWAQDDEDGALIAGTFALAWCGVLLYHAVANKNMEEIYQWVAFVMWLAGNFVWMYGETVNNDDDYVVPRASSVLIAAIAWIFLFHLVLKPFKLITSDKTENSAYHRPGLFSRFSYFETWRDYENIHTLCWLGKDLFWCVENQPGWIICFIPTILIAIDFVYETLRTKTQMVDCVHYFSVFLWVIGNMMWALGNVFTNHDGDDAARDMFIVSIAPDGYMRWIASWVLFAAYWPIIILHLVWIPMTFMGTFDNKPKENPSISGTTISAA